ncbi:hypothetical protein ACRAWB_10810 [Leifsonia poae]|uniref:hypothetical protein n=1 Tax=Leifsonia poae TaxID=110933 RepID=UPI003D686A52
MNDPRIPVLATDSGYRAAVAELPARTRHATADEDARIVVLGRRTRPAFLDAAARADAVILAAGAPWNAEPAPGKAVLVQRRWLRPDVLDDVLAARDGAPHTAVVVECVAATTELPSMLADAVGWARALSPAGIALDHASATTGAGAASLRSLTDDSPISIGWVAQRGAADGGMLRINVLGVVRTEIGIDLAARRTTVDTFTRRGRLRAPERFERAERVALRRAVGALGTGVASDELESLRQDAALAERINHSDSEDRQYALP